MQRIRATAAENHIAVALGYSENENNSLYIAQAYIGSDGTILMNRRKIKPTHLERTVFGDGNGSSLLNVIETPGVGKVGMLSCWEHTQSLLKYHTHSQGEQIHVAAWPPMLPFQEGKGLWSSSAEGEDFRSFDL
jgi:nitrilase